MIDLPGASELHDWFGYWPTFHDAEVLDLELHRSGISTLRIHTWQITDQVDQRGYLILQKHVIVTFTLETIIDLELAGFNHQNVINSLLLEPTEGGYKLTLFDCYGLNGTITALSVQIHIEPGITNDSFLTRS